MKHNRHLDQIKISSHSYKKYFKFIHRISKLFKLQDFGFNVRTLILYSNKHKTRAIAATVQINRKHK